MVWTVPGEWTDHQLTVVAMPWRESVWGKYLKKAWDEYVQLIHMIFESEPVLVLCRPEQHEEAERGLRRSGIRIVAFDYDDGWIRDNGPIITVSDRGERLAVCFDFNSWGGKFVPFDGDQKLGSLVAQAIGVGTKSVNFVLEGGAVSFNGAGVAVVVEECVLNANRNGPEVDRTTFERILRENLGVLTVIWLPFGLLEDLPNTDGHVDNVAVFCGTRHILVQTVPANDPNARRFEANLAVLRDFRFADGGGLTIAECSALPRVTISSVSNQPAPYINYVTTNSSIIIPTVGSSYDDYALSLFRGIYPERRIAVCEARYMTFGGGGPHCVTMQIPSALNVKLTACAKTSYYLVSGSVNSSWL